MKKNLRYFLSICGIFVLIFVYALFQAQALDTKFIVSLYTILSAIIYELWKLISNPTVFIALLILVVIRMFRENIENIFPAIKELSAGSLSAKFEFPEVKFPLSNTTQSILDKTSEAENVVARRIIDTLGISSCNVLLKIDNLPLNVLEFISILSDEKLFSVNYEFYSKRVEIDITNIYYDGILRSLWVYVIPHLMDKQYIEGNKIVRMNFKPGIRKLIKDHLQELERTVTEEDRASNSAKVLG
ncbi:MAG: hypothetical protein IPP66_03585 [Anaerolineales bacterium]|nr:hypothetical protein [Anaerolineales bacterium]